MPQGTEDDALAHDKERAPVSGRPTDEGLVVAGEYSELNENRPRALILESLRELRYPASRDEVRAEADRQRLGPQLLALLERMPERQYVSVEDVAEEAGTPR